MCVCVRVSALCVTKKKKDENLWKVFKWWQKSRWRFECFRLSCLVSSTCSLFLSSLPLSRCSLEWLCLAANLIGDVNMWQGADAGGVGGSTPSLRMKPVVWKKKQITVLRGDCEETAKWRQRGEQARDWLQGKTDCQGAQSGLWPKILKVYSLPFPFFLSFSRPLFLSFLKWEEDREACEKCGQSTSASLASQDQVYAHTPSTHTQVQINNKTDIQTHWQNDALARMMFGQKKMEISQTTSFDADKKGAGP